VPHANAPLSVEGRRRFVKRCQTRPIAHVAAEMGISRACASKWVNRWRLHGDAGLQDRPSSPHRSPKATPARVIDGQVVSAQRDYLGLELVRDHNTLEPATEEIAELCDRMLGLGVIVQPTGDHLDILKIKPPLCIGPTAVDFFTHTLDRALTELGHHGTGERTP
jgi:transposase